MAELSNIIMENQQTAPLEQIQNIRNNFYEKKLQELANETQKAIENENYTDDTKRTYVEDMMDYIKKDPYISKYLEEKATKEKELAEKQAVEDDYNKTIEREDKIRKETQEREDTAYQRAVQDILKAGINPNLLTPQPAESGGGISNASRKNLTLITTQMNNANEQLIRAIVNEFQMGENSKNRLTNIITPILTVAGYALMHALFV